jgi:hypothetical protein
MEIAENVPKLQNAYKIFKNAMNNDWKENSERNNICHRKTFLSQKEASLNGKKLPVTWRHLQPMEETSCYKKKPHVTVRNLVLQEETSCHTKKHLQIDIQMDEHNPKGIDGDGWKCSFASKCLQNL